MKVQQNMFQKQANINRENSHEGQNDNDLTIILKNTQQWLSGVLLKTEADMMDIVSRANEVNFYKQNQNNANKISLKTIDMNQTTITQQKQQQNRLDSKIYVKYINLQQNKQKIQQQQSRTGLLRKLIISLAKSSYMNMNNTDKNKKQKWKQIDEQSVSLINQQKQ